MPSRFHPTGHEKLVGLEATGEVLTGVAEQVGVRSQPDEGRTAVGRLVRPVTQLLHVAHAIRRRTVEPRVFPQRRQMSLHAVLVHRLDDR
jgi:hypothetical protein